jgi:NAD(P)-dependent dehydrogenase (short-subunit alcohol dehydrogenase family)
MAPPKFAAPLISKVHHDIYPNISPSEALAGSTEGATVVITGAGRGIGRAQAIVFARAGAKRVVIAARSAHELDEVEGEIKKVAGATQVVKVITDVTDEGSVKNLFEKAEEVNGSSLSHSAIYHCTQWINDSAYQQRRYR